MHKWYKIKRTLKTSRSSSLDSDLPPVCADDWTFGLKSPIIDFFPGSIVTKFAPLKRILEKGPDEIMLEAYALDAAGSIEKTIEPHSYSFRWIHIPGKPYSYIDIVWFSCELRVGSYFRSRHDFLVPCALWSKT